MHPVDYRTGWLAQTKGFGSVQICVAASHQPSAQGLTSFVEQGWPSSIDEVQIPVPAWIPWH